MKIGLFLANTPGYSETFFYSKIKGLQSNGHDVTLFVAQKTTDFSLCAVKVQPKVNGLNVIVSFLRFCSLFIFNFSEIKTFFLLEIKDETPFLKMIKKGMLNQHVLKTKNLDWLHFGFATLAVDKENLAASIGAKMAVSLRGFDIDVYPLKHKNCYYLLWQKVDKVHSISNYLIEKAYKLGLSKKIPFQIITPAIEINNSNENIVLSPPRTFIQITTVGRLHWIKNYSEILISLKTLKGKGFQFKYTVIGDGNLKEALMYQVYELNLDKEVEFTGKLSHQETLKHIKKTDIYVQYSISEGFCNGVLEAQYYKALCIVSDGGALVENVIDKKTGWIVAKYKPDKLSQKIEEVIKMSEQEKNTIREFASKRIIENFNTKQQKELFIEFYKNQDVI